MLWQVLHGEAIARDHALGQPCIQLVSVVHDDDAVSQVVFSIEPAQVADLAPGASATFIVTGVCASARSVEESLLCALVTGKAQQTLFTVSARCDGLPVRV